MRIFSKFHTCFSSWKRSKHYNIGWAHIKKHFHSSSNTPKVTTKLFIHGKEVESQTDQWVELLSPESNAVISHVPRTPIAELDNAMASATQTMSVLSKIPITYRQSQLQVLYELMKKHRNDFEHILVSEAGKTIIDASTEFQLALTCMQHYMSTEMPLGKSLLNLRSSTDAFNSMESLGVTASITPFNYPLLIPVMTAVPALLAGNPMVTKPSEKIPHTTLMFAKLIKEAGFPDGSLNVVYGHSATKYLCEHPSVRAVTFWGSTEMGRYVYTGAGKRFKRVQCFNGAKNHTVVMPDANKSKCFTKLMEAAFGEGGQRCLSTSVVIFVGNSKNWISDFVVETKKYTETVVNSKEQRLITALISKEARSRICGIIKTAEEQGAIALLDGRGIVVKGYETGNFIGPTILSNIKTDMQCYQEEIFGPVLCVLVVDTLDEAIKIINNNEYGNAAIIHTSSGKAAKMFSSQVDVGQVGVNVATTLPYPGFQLCGSKNSFYGSLYTLGKDAIQFNSKVKTHLQNWKE